MLRRFCCLLLITLFIYGSALAQNKVRMGCVTFAKETTKIAFSQLRDYLAKDLQMNVELTCHTTYAGIIRDLIDDKVDVAMLSPLVLLRTQSARRLRPLAYGIFRSSGYFSYKSVILVRQSSPFTSLRELAGKRLAFVDPNSTSGYHIPKRALQRVGVKLGDLKKVEFYGNHIDAIKALLAGQVDAAATFEDLVERNDVLAKDTRKIRRLWTSNFVIPADCFATTSKVSLPLRKKLRSALLAYFAAQRNGEVPLNKLYEGFVPGDPTLYDELKVFLGPGL